MIWIPFGSEKVVNLPNLMSAKRAFFRIISKSWNVVVQRRWKREERQLELLVPMRSSRFRKEAPSDRFNLRASNSVDLEFVSRKTCDEHFDQPSLGIISPPRHLPALLPSAALPPQHDCLCCNIVLVNMTGWLWLMMVSSAWGQRGRILLPLKFERYHEQINGDNLYLSSPSLSLHCIERFGSESSSEIWEREVHWFENRIVYSDESSLFSSGRLQSFKSVIWVLSFQRKMIACWS